MLTFEHKESFSFEERQNEDVYELPARPGGLWHVCNDICLPRPSLIPIGGQLMLQTVEFTFWVAPDGEKMTKFRGHKVFFAM